MLNNYVKSILRDLWRNKLYWTVNSLGLAVGVAVALLAFQYASHEFSYDRFYDRSEDIYRIQANQQLPDLQNTTIRSSYLLSDALKNEVPQIELAAGVQSATATMEYAEKKLQDVALHFAHKDLIKLFELKFVGSNSSNRLDEPNTIILTQSLADKIFGVDVSAVGKVISINTQFNGQSEVLVTGVVEDLPSNSHFNSSAFLPMSSLDQRNFIWPINNCQTYVRISSDADPKQVNQLMKSLWTKYPINKEGSFRTVLNFELFPVSDIYLSEADWQMGEGNRKMIITFLVFALLILLTASTNYMNLAAARYTQKSRQVGVRKVIGAQRRQIISQVLVESFAMSIIAIFIGGLLAETGSIALNNITQKPLNIAFIQNPSLIATFIVFTFFIAAISSLYPAYQLSAVKVSAALKGTLSRGRKGRRSRQGLVAFQFIVSAGLIVSTLVIYKQMQFVMNKDLGYNPSNVIIVELPEGETKAALFRTELSKNSLIVSSAAATVPLGGFQHIRKFTAINKSGQVIEENTSYSQVDQQFLDILEFSLVSGQTFDSEFNISQPQVIVNETLVNQMGWENPLEETLGIYNYETRKSDQQAQIIGVIKDFNLKSLHQQVEPHIYFPLAQFYKRQNFLHVKVKSPAEAMNFIKASYDQIEQEKVFSGWFLEDTIAESYANDKVRGKIHLVLTSLSIFVACLGLFGLAFLSVRTRTKEIAIRKVLGSSISGIITVLSKELAVIIVVAFLIAFPLATLFMNQWLTTFAYRVSIGVDIFVLAILATLSIALISVAYQAFNTSHIDPAKTLKEE